MNGLENAIFGAIWQKTSKLGIFSQFQPNFQQSIVYFPAKLNHLMNSTATWHVPGIFSENRF